MISIGQLSIKSTAAYRLIALGALFIAFYSLDWLTFRYLLRDFVMFILSNTLHVLPVLHDGSPGFGIGQQVFVFTPECTYFDLMFMVGPLLWSTNTTFRRNIVRIGACFIGIALVNLLRVCASIWITAQGADWFYAHDLPDYIVWWPTAAVACVFALRCDVAVRL
jgi:exosortase/archaeosortase family protein